MVGRDSGDFGRGLAWVHRRGTDGTSHSFGHTDDDGIDDSEHQWAWDGDRSGGEDPPGWVKSMEWRPKVPVRDLRQFTDEEKLEFWNEHVAELASRHRLDDPPEVELERWIRFEETGPVLGRCLSEFGYEMTYDPFPGISGGPETHNGDDFTLAYEREAWYVCLARFPIDPTYLQPPTSDQARIQYDYWNEVWLPRMRGLGLRLVNPPDLKTFVQEYVARGGGSPWSEVTIDGESILQCGQSRPAPAAYYGP